MSTRGPRPERSPGNDIRLIANYCQRLDKILDRLTSDEIAAMDADDRDFLAYFARETSTRLHNARLWALDSDHPEAIRAHGYDNFITKRSIL